jgi:hypothetical protein
VVQVNSVVHNNHYVPQHQPASSGARSGTGSGAGSGRANLSSSNARDHLCRAAHGCEQEELTLLLEHTQHTIESIQLVNVIYRRDFELLGYRQLLASTSSERGEPHEGSGSQNSREHTAN